MTAALEHLVDGLGRVAAWVFVVIGGMIAWEVVARYVFNAPTIWAEELARFGQIWAVYLAAACVLRRRRLIAIGLVVDRLPAGWRRAADLFALALIAGFALLVLIWGADIAWDSFRRGRGSASMLDVPVWLTEIAVPLGALLLLLQCWVEAVLVCRGGTLGRAGEADA
jgi:TRAP-type C4-dicarboxylate transport system permease small subunit